MTISSPSSNDGVTGGGWGVVGGVGEEQGGWTGCESSAAPSLVPLSSPNETSSATAAHQSEQTAAIKSSVSSPPCPLATIGGD